MNRSTSKPIIGISMGDPAGIGPEIIVKAIGRPIVRQLCRPIVIGDAQVIRNATKFAHSLQNVRPIAKVSEARFAGDTIDVLELKNVDLAKLELGRVSPMAGHAAFEA